MNDEKTLDKLALDAAKKRMGRFAWPTVVLGGLAFASYLAAYGLAMSGGMSLWLAVVLMGACTYLSYTVMHEAVHGSINGSHKSLRWLNEVLGYVAGWVLMTPLTAHRHEHLAHHRNTNDPEEDPDYVVSNMARSPLHAMYAGIRILAGQYRYYLSHRWGRGPRGQDFRFCLEISVALGGRVVLIANGLWLEGTLLFLLSAILGVALVMYLFAYIVHTPHENVGRYVDTSTFVVQGKLGLLVTLLWGFQNYHSIHHLFPRVPFYCYRDLFEEIEPLMLSRGAPVYHLTRRGFRQPVWSNS